MTRAQLILQENEVSFTGSDHIICRLALHWDRLAFPHPEWSDFAVVVLSWWAQAAERLLAGARGPVKVSFMDGPYEVAIERAESGVWRVQCIETGRRPVVRHDVRVEPGPLVESVLAAADGVLELCRTRGLRDRDTTHLISAVASLKKQYARSSA